MVPRARHSPRKIDLSVVLNWRQSGLQHRPLEKDSCVGRSP
jgi:hypothetical protein